MKKLTHEEEIDLSEEKAFEIVDSWGEFLTEKFLLYHFNSELEWHRNDIFHAYLKLIKKFRYDDERFEACLKGLIWLNHIIPDQSEYQELLELMKNGNKIMTEGKKQLKNNNL